uniref:EF-hand domain-containing protein n=1 Tax=Aegilops tauschii subsp. strangulata TaxID=200361 RepID=A0A453FG79_AEGTS
CFVFFRSVLALATMAGHRQSLAAASLKLPALLLLLIFSLNWGHAVAHFDPANMTELQKHVSFFDRNKDGFITPVETIQGFVAIGCEYAFATAASASIHGALAPQTTPAGTPLPHLTIYVENIHKAMHGSDSGVYDPKGRFLPQKFEELFKTYAILRPDALTLAEMHAMLFAKRDLDPISWAPPEIEWGLLFTLASDWLGFLHKDSVRGIYDGSVFTKLEKKWHPSQSDI